jgi:hypothetical protein
VTASAAAWRAAGHGLAALALGVPCAGLDVVDRQAWLPAPDEGNTDALRVVLAAGVLARQSVGLGPGLPLPVHLPARSWVDAAILLDANATELGDLAAFLDEVLLIPGDQLANWWAGEPQ